MIFAPQKITTTRNRTAIKSGTRRARGVIIINNNVRRLAPVRGGSARRVTDPAAAVRKPERAASRWWVGDN